MTECNLAPRKDGVAKVWWWHSCMDHGLVKACQSSVVRLPGVHQVLMECVDEVVQELLAVMLVAVHKVLACWQPGEGLQ